MFLKFKIEKYAKWRNTNSEYVYNGDRLVSFNGEQCEYNNVGSPTVYRDKPATWKYGKLLASYNGVSFTYDGQGKRIGKNGISYTYDAEGNLITSSDGLEFIYDNTGVLGVKYNKQQYFYRKGVQGNIIALLDEAGNIVVEYQYDAWGNHAVLDAEGHNIIEDSNIGNINPFRYRSYYFDTETGFYYLQTRYYDPKVGRFISQDLIEYADPQTINGLNLYAYCGNNPVMNVDPSGTVWWNPATWNWGAVRDWAATIIGVTNPIGIICGAGAVINAARQGRWNEVVDDWNNGCFNPFNQDENIAINSNVFSFYKGEYVVRHSISNSSSMQLFGTIFLETRSKSTDLNHEWGHGIQEKLMGGAYIFRVGIPSLITCCTLSVNRPYYEKIYYSMPWDRMADFLGGVNRSTSTGYKKGSLGWAFAENILGIIAIPFYFIFGY